MSTIPNTDRPEIVVTHYGVHWTSSGVAFLEQGGPKGGSNALGLREKSPFKVQAGRGRMCNHLIPLAAPSLNPLHVEVFTKILRDPLAMVMLPLPKPEGHPGVWFIDENIPGLPLYLSMLSRLSSPVRSIIQPMWATKLPTILDELRVTNIQPLVLTGITPSHTADIARLAQVAATLPRRLILCGEATVPLPLIVVRLTTEITKYDLNDLMVLPWENQGATLVRRHMRGEAI